MKPTAYLDDNLNMKLQQDQSIVWKRTQPLSASCHLIKVDEKKRHAQDVSMICLGEFSHSPLTQHGNGDVRTKAAGALWREKQNFLSIPLILVCCPKFVGWEGLITSFFSSGLPVFGHQTALPGEDNYLSMRYF